MNKIEKEMMKEFAEIPDRTAYEEIKDSLNGGVSGRYRAAAIIAEKQGDKEVSDVLFTLSGQMEFDDNEESVTAIEKTRKKLDNLIKERKKQNSTYYREFIRDEEILELSNGEVAIEGYTYDYNLIESKFVKGGLFDPAIFGGTGRIPVLEDDNQSIIEPFGRGMGHITLPIYVISIKKAYEIGILIGLTADEVEEVAHYIKGVVVESTNPKYPVKSLTDGIDIPEGVKVEWGGDAIHTMLLNLNYSDHPERLAFKVIPVVCPRLRPMFGLPCGRFNSASLNRKYGRLLSLKRWITIFMDKGPEIVVRLKKRELQSAVETLLGDWEDNTNYKNFLDIAANRKKFCIEGRRQSLMAARYRSYDYEKVDIGEPEEIESINFYPKEVNLKEKDGTMSKIALHDVLENNQEAVNRWEEVHTTFEELDEDSDEKTEEERIKEQADGAEYDRLNNLVWEAIDQSHVNRDIVVEFDDKTEMYVVVE